MAVGSEIPTGLGSADRQTCSSHLIVGVTHCALSLVIKMHALPKRCVRAYGHKLEVYGITMWNSPHAKSQEWGMHVSHVQSVQVYRTGLV